MDNNIKLVYSNYDDETGISIVRIQTPEGTFKGKARLNPKDENVASKYVGCKYAEIRAWIKYYHYLSKIKASNIREITKLNNQINQDKTVPKRVKKWGAAHLNALTKEKKEYDDMIAELKEQLTFEMQERDKFLDILNKHKQKAKNK